MGTPAEKISGEKYHIEKRGMGPAKISSWGP